MVERVRDADELAIEAVDRIGQPPMTVCRPPEPPAIASNETGTIPGGQVAERLRSVRQAGAG